MEKKQTLVKQTFRRILIINGISMVSGILCVLIDAIVTGKYLGTAAVTASGLTNPIVLLSSLLGILFSPGVGVICSRYMGKAEPEKCNKVFSIVMIAILISVGAASVLLFILAPAIANLLGSGTGDAQIPNMISGYLRGYALAMLPTNLGSALASLMMLDNDRKKCMASFGLVLIGDIVFDLANVLIFHGGMFGMALATALSNLLGLLFLLTHFLKKDRILHFTPHDLHMGDLKDVILCGTQTLVSMGSQSLRGLLFNALLLSISGSGAVAAFAVWNSVFSVVSSLAIGIFFTASTLCSMLYGEEDRSGVTAAFSVAIRTAVRVFAVIAVILLVFARPIAGLFLDASASGEAAQATRFVRFMSIRYFLASVSYSFCGAYQGIGRTKLIYLYNVLREGILPVLCCAVLGFLFGLAGFEIGLPISGGLMLLACYLIQSNSWFYRVLWDFVNGHIPNRGFGYALGVIVSAMVIVAGCMALDAAFDALGALARRLLPRRAAE